MTPNPRPEGPSGPCPDWCELPAPHPGQAHAKLVLHLADHLAVELIANADRAHVALTTVDPEVTFEIGEDLSAALGRLILNLPDRERAQFGDALVFAGLTLEEAELP